MRSGELARLTGISADSIRHYERLGILPKAERTEGGYRIYPPSTIQRVHLTQRALQLGFTLKEISEILQTRDNGGAPCQRVLKLTEEKLHSLGQQIQELRRTQAYMRQVLRNWRKKLERTPPGSKAMLLHSLSDKIKLKPVNNLTRKAKP